MSGELASTQEPPKQLGFLDISPVPDLYDLPRGLRDIGVTASFLSPFTDTVVGGLTKRVESLPLLRAAEIRTDLRPRALGMYAMIANMLIHNPRQDQQTNILPPNISQPLLELSTIYDIPPILSYFHYILLNTEVISGIDDSSINRLRSLWKFTGTESEELFIRVHAAIEAEAAVMVRAARRVAQDSYQDITQVSKDLTLIKKAVEQMIRLLGLMRKHLDKKEYKMQFDERLRPFLAHTQNVVYEGTDLAPQSWIGVSTIQSPIGPLGEAMFGVRHNTEEIQDRLNTGLLYLPSTQRKLITINRRSSLQERIIRSGDEEAALSFDEALAAFAMFRSQQLELAERYLVGRKPGKGSTKFKKFLIQVYEDTLRARLLS